MLINNAVLTGSFTVNGVNYITNTPSTGSNTFVGTQIISGSTLMTGSLGVTGSVSVSGSITATGTLTAQTLVVQTVTSSIVYSSGSNRFGNQLTDVQQMTGSLKITGSLSLNNIAIPTSASLASTYLPLAGGTITGAATFSSSVQIGTAVTNYGTLQTYSGYTSASLTVGTAAAAIFSCSAGQELALTMNGTAPYGVNFQARNNTGGGPSGTTYPIIFNPLGGNVGIGTSSPQSIVHALQSNATEPTSGTTPSGYGLSFGSGNGYNGGIWFSSDFGADQGICGIAGTRVSNYDTDLRFYKTIQTQQEHLPKECDFLLLVN